MCYPIIHVNSYETHIFNSFRNMRHLDERIGIDAMCEGDPDIEYPELIGFSVPTHVIMTKISDE